MGKKGKVWFCGRGGWNNVNLKKEDDATRRLSGPWIDHKCSLLRFCCYLTGCRLEICQDMASSFLLIPVSAYSILGSGLCGGLLDVTVGL